MRETRHLWIGNLAENTREEFIADHFKRYGKIDKVRLLPKRSSDSSLSACVAFMDIRSAQKAKNTANVIGERELITDYYDPAARAGSSGSTSRATDEGRRRSNQTTAPASGRANGPSHGNRSYERERDRPDSFEKHYAGSGDDRAENYDSDRGKGRLETTEREKPRATSRPSHELSSKKQKSEGKASKKKAKNNADDRTKGGVPKKGKVKRPKAERGRSPTVKQKKTHATPGGKKGPKTSPSTSDGRSSSSGSGSASTSRSGRTSSASSSGSTSSTNSTGSPTNSQGSESSYETEEGRKLVAMCIKKLPTRPTVTSLRDGIFHEFKKYGKVKSVVVRGDGADRHALVLFRTAAEANKAVSHAKSKLLFGAAIEASIYEGEVSGQELEECGGIIDEFHPRASRTLFVGNLDKTVSYSDIQNIFVRFGEIVAIEIKKQHNIPQYAFLQYTDIVSVVRAITKMDGEKLGRNPLKLGFGKTVVSSCLWVDGVTDSFTENYLASCFQRYGLVKHVVIDRNRGQALVFYGQYDFAQTAMAKMRARKLNGSRLKMDYASHELIDIFLKHMQSSGQSIQGLENIRQLLQPPLSPTGSMQTPNVLTSSLSSGSQHYSRSSMPQEMRGYYDDHTPSVNYSDIGSGQYASGESYRRNWRGRSRERYPYTEQSSHSRHGKRAYEDSYERTEYHRERSPGWEHESYDRRPAVSSRYDQDYRQKDYDVRREQRVYDRKPVSSSAVYEDSYHYRGSRERPREPERGRDLERTRDRDGYYPRSSHVSPSHVRYVSRKSRSPSPHSRLRDIDRGSMERSVDSSAFRRRGRSGTPSPELQAEIVINRRNSVESKSSSRSGSRYASRSGDVDMRETISPLLEKSRTSHPIAEDERIVGLREKPSKSRVRSRIVVESPSKRDEEPLSPKRSHRQGYKSSDAGSDVAVHSKKEDESQDYEPESWAADSPNYSEERSRSGTPTRDENQDLIGEVIIKQPSVSSSVSKPAPRKVEISGSKEDKKYDLERKDSRSKPRDKDYRKGFNVEASRKERKSENTFRNREERSSGSKSARSNSSGLIQRVHSPPELERKSSLQYTKDFDYRKHSVRPSKSSGDGVQRTASSGKAPYEHYDSDERPRKQKVQSYARLPDDDKPSSSPLSPSSQGRSRSSGSTKLLKREYSPSSQDESQTSTHHGHKSRKRSGERTKHDLERQRSSGRGRDYTSTHGSRDRDDRYAVARISREVDKDVHERRSVPQKRRFLADAKDGDPEELPEVSIKRERKSSTGDGSFPKSKLSHHPLLAVKHEAPMSIARQMFLQEEDESGADSPMLRLLDEEVVDVQDVVQEECVSQSPGHIVTSQVSDDQASPPIDFDDGAPHSQEVKDEDATAFQEFSLNAARSLLPKRLPKSTTSGAMSSTQIQIDEQKAKIEKEVNEKGNLLDLEREKIRLQEMLSKLDSEKQLDVKEAAEVAGVVLNELTNKAKSKILASRPPKEAPAPKKSSKKSRPADAGQSVVAPKNDYGVVVEPDGPAESKSDIPLEETCEVEETTVEEEIVVDTIEEVTEDEVIETEVEEIVDSEVTVQDLPAEETTSANVPQADEPAIQEPPPIAVDTLSAAKEVPPVVKKKEEIDHTQGYRKQMEARKREKDKMEKKLLHDRKKLLRKQEKEKKKQMKRVLAMRGPSQSVISSVDDEDNGAAGNEASKDEAEEETPEAVDRPHGKHPLSDQEEEAERKKAKHDSLDADAEESFPDTSYSEQKVTARDDPSPSEPSVCDTGKSAGSVDTNKNSTPVDNGQAKNEPVATLQKQNNLDLEKPWPPDKDSQRPEEDGKRACAVAKAEVKSESGSQKASPADGHTNGGGAESSSSQPVPAMQLDQRQAEKVGNAASRSVSPITPGSTGQGTPVVATTPQVPSKEPTPSPGGMNNLQALTPTGSLASSVSHKSARTTPVTTPSQISKTPTFTTPSPASSSSTSSSKSQARPKTKTTPLATQHASVPNQTQKKSVHPSRQDHHSRSRASHSADHKRRSSQHHHRGQPSSSHGHKVKEVSKIKPVQSRRPMASITVGLDASPSKPLGKTELERLKMELESVKSQLSMDMSPNSLSPCSGDEAEEKSPAQLLSPVSPILRSPADPMVSKKVSDVGGAVAAPVANSSNTPSLTDRLKLLGRVKKRAPGQGIVVKTEEQVQGLNQNRDTMKELEFRQSRMFRSSIFDQDSERLLHFQRQLEEERKQLEAQQNAMPLSSGGPLFSGSRFLEQTAPVTAPVQNDVGMPATVPQQNSLPAGSPTAVAAPNLTSVVNSSSQSSSTSGPKNVYSLSSCELPATAERIAQNDSGKNCNITDNVVNTLPTTALHPLPAESPPLQSSKDEEGQDQHAELVSDASATAVEPAAMDDKNFNHTEISEDPSHLVTVVSDPPPKVKLEVEDTGTADYKKEFDALQDSTQASQGTTAGLETTDSHEADMRTSEMHQAIDVPELPQEEDRSEIDMASSGELMVSEEVVADVSTGTVVEENHDIGGDYFGAAMEVVDNVDVFTGVSETVEMSLDAEVLQENVVEVSIPAADDENEQKVPDVTHDVPKVESDPVAIVPKIAPPDDAAVEDAVQKPAENPSTKKKADIQKAGQDEPKSSKPPEKSPEAPAPAPAPKTGASDKDRSQTMAVATDKSVKSDSQLEKKHSKPAEFKKENEPSKDKKKKASLLLKAEGSAAPKKQKSGIKVSSKAPTSEKSDGAKASGEKRPAELKKPEASGKKHISKVEGKPKSEGLASQSSGLPSKKKSGKFATEKKKVEQSAKTDVKMSEKKVSTGTERSKSPSELQIGKQAPSKSGQAEKDAKENVGTPIPKNPLPETDSQSTTKDSLKTKESDSLGTKHHKREGSNSKERKSSKHLKKEKLKLKPSKEAKQLSKPEGKKQKDSPASSRHHSPHIARTDDPTRESKSPLKDPTKRPKAEAQPVKTQVDESEGGSQGKVEEVKMQVDEEKSGKEDVPRKEAKMDSGIVKKKKKKKKHQLDKDKERVKSKHDADGKVEMTAAEKQSKADTKEADDAAKKEKGQKVDKIKKSKSAIKPKKLPEAEKQTLPEKQSSAVKTEPSEGKVVKKSHSSSLKKEGLEKKKHGLKVSQSLTSDTKSKEKPSKHKQEKASTHKKIDKSSSAAGHQSRYSMIYDSSSSDSDVVSMRKKTSKKNPDGKEHSSPSRQKDDDDESMWKDEDADPRTTTTTVWSDLEDEGEDSRSRPRISSSISSSSMSDSAGPPPVVTSSCLVTETIKSETILPPGYDEEEFSSSFYKMDDSKRKDTFAGNKAAEVSGKSSKSSKKKKKKLISAPSPSASSAKKKGKQREPVKVGRRLIRSSSEDSDSDDEPAMLIDTSHSDSNISDSDLSGFRTKPATKSTPVKLAPAIAKPSVSYMDFSTSDSDAEVFSSRSNASTPKADVSVKPDKLSDVKSVSKFPDSHKVKKTHGSSATKSKQEKPDSSKHSGKTHEKKEKQHKAKTGSKTSSQSNKEAVSAVPEEKAPDVKAHKKEQRGEEQVKSTSKDEEKREKTTLSERPKDKDSAKHEKSHSDKKESTHKPHKHPSKGFEKSALSQQKSTKEAKPKVLEKPSSSQDMKKAVPKSTDPGPSSQRDPESLLPVAKEKQKSGKHQERTNSSGHKKKKLKKKSKQEKHEKKVTAEKKVEQPDVEHDKPPTIVPKPQPKPVARKQDVRPHSIFDSESEESAGEGPVQRTGVSEKLHPEKELPQEKREKSYETVKPQGKQDRKLEISVEKSEVTGQSPSKRPKAKSKVGRSQPGSSQPSPRRTEKRRGSAESFLTTSTTDDSDIEQRMAVQSALSALDKDADIASESVESPLVKEEPGNLEIVEEDFPTPPHDVQNRDEETVSAGEKHGKKRSLDVLKVKKGPSPSKPEKGQSPSKRPDAGVSESASSIAKSKRKDKGSDREKRHGKKDVDRWKGSAYRSREHGIFAEKKRLEDMERMKSLSHEQDEEAVRSIVGIMDESSDADSYYSDIRPESEVVHGPPGKGAAEPESSKRHSFDSDSVGGTTPRRSSDAAVKVEDAVKDEKESDPEGDASDARTTAEEKELAAAVSSIEGLFGDFDRKPPSDDFRPSRPALSYMQQEEQQDSAADSVPAEVVTSGAEETETRSQEEIERGSTEAALAASALLESTEDEDPFFGYQPTPVPKSSAAVVSSLTDSEANDTDSGLNAASCDDAKQATDDASLSESKSADIELPSIRMDLPRQENADISHVSLPVSTPSVPESSSGRKRQRPSQGPSPSHRSSSHESKSDWSVSDASESEHEARPSHNKTKAAKQRKLDTSTAVTQSGDSYDFDAELKTQNLSLPKPEAREPKEMLPFVATTCVSSFPPMLPSQTCEPDVAAKVSTSGAETAAAYAPASRMQIDRPQPEQNPQKHPPSSVQPRRRSSEVVSPAGVQISPTGIPHKRRSSSSSSSAAHSPSRGSHLSQLTPSVSRLTSPSASQPGMRMPAVSPAGGVISFSYPNAPFVPQSHATGNMPVQRKLSNPLPSPQQKENTLPESPSARHIARSYPSMGPPANAPLGSRSDQTFPTHHGAPPHLLASQSQNYPLHHAISAPRAPASQGMVYPEPNWSASHGAIPSLQPHSLSAPHHARPSVPLPSSAPYGAQSEPTVLHHTNPQSMMTHHTSAASALSGTGLTKPAGMQPAADKDVGSVPPLVASVPPAAPALTPPALSQHPFAYSHQPPGSQAQVRMQTATHHIGVPTYPHHQPPVRHGMPAASLPQHRPVHQDMPPVRPEVASHSSNLPRPNFSHAHAERAPHQTPAPHPQRPALLQPYPQRHLLTSPGQQPVTLPPPQISPSAGYQGVPQGAHEAERHAAMRRTTSNPYMQQMTSGPMPPIQTPPRPAVPSQVAAPGGVTPVRPTPQAKPDKPEPQHMPPQPSHPASMPAPRPTQVSPQAGTHKKPEPGQPRMLQAMPQQQLFTHPLYYPQGLHIPPGMYPPGFPGLQYLRAGMMPHGFLPGQAGLPHGQLLHPPTSQHLVQQRAQAPVKADAKDHHQTQPASVHVPGRKEAQTPTSTIASPMPHGVNRSVPLPARPQMHPQMFVTSPSHLQRPPHGDRVVRAQADLSQEDMVVQHFVKSGFNIPEPSSSKQKQPPSGPPAQSPGPPQDRHVPPNVGERPPEGGMMHPAFQRNLSPRPPSKQEPANPRPPYPLPPGMYPNPSFAQQAAQSFQGMPLPHGYPLPGGARFAGDPNLWARQGYRPLPVSVPMSMPSPASSVPPVSNVQLVQARPPAPVSSGPQPSPTTPKADTSDMVMDLFQRYPVVWQGLLALRANSAAVQAHFVFGNMGLAQACLPNPDMQQVERDEERNLAVLRIMQRMRLEPLQLEGVDKRMTADSDFCVLLALPCGRDKTDVIRQQDALKQGFVDYLKQKQAAGIVNVQNRQSQDQVQYVLHVFPPCDFTTKHLQRHAQDLLSNINDIQHIMIVIAAA